jgi:hypothetical protein
VTGRGSLSPSDIEPFDVFANRGKLRDSGNSARSAATSSNLGETDRRTAKLEFLSEQREDRDVQEIFELLFQDSQRNVYAGGLDEAASAASV